MILTIPMGSTWMKSHPNFQAIPEAKDFFAGIPPNTIKQQNDISQPWMSTNWTGVCDELKVSSNTLIITGTDNDDNDDNNVPSPNCLIIAKSIPRHD